MATQPSAPTLPSGLRAALVGEVASRLEAMAQAIVTRQTVRRDQIETRIGDLLDALEEAAVAGGAEGEAALLRAVRRMVMLAAAHDDPLRCRQAIVLLQRISC